MKLKFSKLLQREVHWLLEAAGLLVIGLSLAACTQGKDTLAVGDPAPDFSASTAAGGTVSLSDSKNEQPVLLFFHMAVG
jgi:hypothetical protein